MIPVSQTKRGGADVPPEERGDCMAACIASVLEVLLVTLPCLHSDGDDWWDRIQGAVAAHGHGLVFVHDTFLPTADVYWLAAVPSLNLKREDGSALGHMIVMRGAVVAHDPSLGRRYAAGTHLTDLLLIEGYVLVPLAKDGTS